MSTLMSVCLTPFDFIPLFHLYVSVLCSKTFQVLSYIAKGSFGPILKVKDKARQKTYAVKVSLPPNILLQNSIIVVVATAF